jgi:hypothetical protein
MSESLSREIVRLKRGKSNLESLKFERRVRSMLAITVCESLRNLRLYGALGLMALILGCSVREVPGLYY